MTAALSILLRTCSAFVVALAGGALSAILARTHKQLCALISLGAGTLLGVTVFAIVPECFETLSWWQFLLAAATGYGLFALISKYVFHVCPACAASHFDEATTHHFGEIAIPMLVALAIHCTVDGLALAAGHEEPVAPASGHWLDVSMTFAICVHKMPGGSGVGRALARCGIPSRANVMVSGGGRIHHHRSAACSAGLSCGMFPKFGWRWRWLTRVADSCSLRPML